jgi:PST family polysaccharide transporter
VNNIWTTVRNSTDVFLNSLMPNLYNSFSTVLLGVFGGEVANGKLDAGAKFVNIAQQFMRVLSRTFFPFLSRKLDKHKVYAQLNIVLSLCMSVLLFFSAPLIIDWIFTEEFAESIKVLRIMSISIFFLALNNIYGTNYMIIAGYESQLRNITAMVSVVGFALSFPLIYYWGFIGAAITITLTRGLLGTSVMLKAKMLKQKDVRQD